jgi:hypothetical protein
MDFFQRLKSELNELSHRIEKLKDFMVTLDYQFLPQIQRSLLTSQLSVMISYQTILQERIIAIEADSD